MSSTSVSMTYLVHAPKNAIMTWKHVGKDILVHLGTRINTPWLYSLRSIVSKVGLDVNAKTR